MKSPTNWKLLALLGLVWCAGCSSQGLTQRIDEDPLEPINRVMYKFNDAADTYIMRPVAQGYEALLPQFLRTGINNFFRNLDEPRNLLNNLLQGKARAALSDAARMGLNTTLGLGGLLDPASDAGLTRHDEDLGQTFAVWGLPRGPYLVLPLLGPYTARHGIGSLGDWSYHPQRIAFDSSVRDKINIVWIIDARAALLGAAAQIDQAFDEYSFVRDAYLQNRAYLIHDGEPPDPMDELEEGLDEFEDFESL